VAGGCFLGFVRPEPEVLQEEQGGGEVEEAREDVLAFADPRDRFDVHRMHREDGGDQPGRRYVEKQEDSPEQHGAGGVQEDIDDVVARRVCAPELVLDPEKRVRDRIILRDRARLGPDAREPFERAEREVFRDVVVVVPDVTGTIDRDVRDHGQRHQRDDRHPRRQGGGMGFGSWLDNRPIGHVRHHARLVIDVNKRGSLNTETRGDAAPSTAPLCPGVVVVPLIDGFRRCGHGDRSGFGENRRDSFLCGNGHRGWLS
jgi:hypothetical protein